jgi:hypothetical protein
MIIPTVEHISRAAAKLPGEPAGRASVMARLRTLVSHAGQVLAFTTPGSPPDALAVKRKFPHCGYPYCA